MNLKKVRKYRKILNKTAGLFKENPVFALAMTLPFIIVPAVSLKSAVVMCLFIFVSTVPSAVVATLVKDKVKSIYAIPLYCVIAMLAVTLLRIKLKSHAVILEEIGIYIWLTAINSIMIKLSATKPRKKWVDGLKDAVMMCLGFSMACCFVGAIRELLVSKTIWGNPVSFAKTQLIAGEMPFFGFIIIGFACALFRSFSGAITYGLFSSPSRVSHKNIAEESAGDKA